MHLHPTHHHLPLLLLSTLTLLPITSPTPIVSDPLTRLTYIGTASAGVDQFLGIPFAADTSGPNRFAPPKPYTPAPGTGEIDATKPGHACPQGEKSIAPPFMADVPAAVQGEDCLNLRIARPSAVVGGGGEVAGLPVMVYLYGGGSQLGTAYDTYFDPVGLVQQSVANGQPVVYVAVNYRIGLFGFAASKGLREAKAENLGLRDQRAGLRWVRDNIAAFGGDPEKVTLFGQSFGGISVGLQLVAYGGEAEPLFQKAVMTSGALAGDRSDEFAVSNTAAVAEKVGCAGGGEVDEDVLECLRETPLEELQKANLEQAKSVKPPFGFAAFSPCVDGDFLPDKTSNLIKEGRFLKDIPLLASWTADDGSLSADASITNDSGVINNVKSSIPNFNDDIAAKILDLYPVEDFEAQAEHTEPQASPQYFRASRIIRDLDPVCPLLTLTQRVHQLGSTVFLAELNATRLTPYWHAMGVPWGVSHLSDVPYFFNEELPENGDNTASAMELSKQYAGSFASFASSGDPVGGNGGTFAEWPPAYGDVAGDGKAAVLVIGGPYGTRPAVTGPEEKELGVGGGEKVELRKRARRGSHGQRVLGMGEGGTAVALEREKLVQRCQFLDSVRA